MATDNRSMFGNDKDPWRALRAIRWPRRARPTTASEQPLRAELYSAGQMEQQGEILAAAHRNVRAHGPDRLLPRLADNELVLRNACAVLSQALQTERRITPAGEWLLDNFYLIEEQIHTARRHLPRRYSWELPRLTGGPSAGFPRVYDIALQAISHGDGRIDQESLLRFVGAYQRVTPLNLGELWAIPIMLRLALIENLRRVGHRIAIDRSDRNLADTWADRISHIAESDSKNLILVIADMARSKPPMVSAFVAEFARRLQGHSHALALALTWVEQSLAESGLTIAQLVQAENQQQAANQLSISNSIGSLRFLAVMDWREFVENLSATDQVLRRDPAGIYLQMDFATRDRYRHVVEKLSKRGKLAEVEVARAALELARAAAAAADAGRTAHVGYYLVDAGLAQLERAAGVPRLLRRHLADMRLRVPLFVASILVLAAAGTAIALVKADRDGVGDGALVAVGLLGALIASQLAVAIVNRVASMLVAPGILPRMDFDEGIPGDARTLVVVPTLLGDAAWVDALVDGLELRFLGNRDPNLHFGLLTDFLDAAQETCPGDAAILQRAQDGIDQLNRTYGAEDGEPVFFLFHRPRRWNARERVWMGYERKRGKLGDLNALLRGRGAGSFSLIVGDLRRLAGVKYVITLDSDTQLPRDSARLLVATMAHPLNQACCEPASGVVRAGYGILQPRVAASLPSVQRSRYARLHAGEAGIDPYTRAVSDVYQDVFGEGSFIGKGIYDVDAFERTLGQRLPENRILSHDLLEGCYARSGLLSDVELVEDYPTTYRADVRRRHRWIRGDWQIARWLLPTVKEADGASVRNPLSALSRWKIFDNLRRSLVPAAALLLLLLGWIALPAPWFWTGIVLGVTFVPAVAETVLDLLRGPGEARFTQYLRTTARTAAQRFGNLLFGLACLPHEAAFSADAIARTIARMLITRRNRLQWTPSGDVNRRSAVSLAASLRALWSCPALALATGAWLAHARPLALAVAGPVLLLWLAAPFVEWWLSRPSARRAIELSADESAFLRLTARRTWAFFDELVSADDQWLPPDNVQEHPSVVVAHRTSPTNIGMALLSTLAAHDFGYLSCGALLERLGRTFDTMSRLERERGHFYNWYDTQTLQPLLPLYVSTVDSGNLCAHLLTLQGGLRALPDQPIIGTQTWLGLRDTFALVTESSPDGTDDVLAAFRARLERVLRECPASLADNYLAAAELCAAAQRIAARVVAAAAGDAGSWARALDAQAQGIVDDLGALMPWLSAGSALAATPALARVPTLRGLAALAAAPPDPAGDGADAAQAADEDAGGAARLLGETAQRAAERLATIEERARQAGALADMDFSFLYDEDRHLFTIGYNVSDRRRDLGYYDLLASEARLAVFVAVALGQVPQESWFALGRLLTQSGGLRALLSWSGSMFEYLMPLLVMPAYADTLLDETCTAAVQRQIEYGVERRVAWGISESGYNAVDAAHNYRYRAFGVPGLGLTRGLAEDLVVTPHATVLAAMLAPKQAVVNLRALAGLGMLGRYGFFEAIDYTPARLRRGERFAIVRSFMAHHQGMSLVALADLLLAAPMRKRFVAQPIFRATLPLLQERVPRTAATFLRAVGAVDTRAIVESIEMPVRTFTTADTPRPAVQLLSNGRYHVMVSNAGGGYSRWRDLAVTRWREDITCDNWGTFFYIRDVDSGRLWSNTPQPTLALPESYEATFTGARVEFNRRDGGIETRTDIAVSPEDDIELRRVRISNRSPARRTIEVTSYAEVVLGPPVADAMHRVFSNLFVQSEIVAAHRAILCSRRPRANGEHWPALLHLLVPHGAVPVQTSYETDRARFIGRGNGVADPLALRAAGPLSDTAGAVLDPIVAIRHRFVLEPEQALTVDLVTGIGDSRGACLALAEKYQDTHLGDRVFDLARTHTQVALRQLNINEADAQLYERLAGHVLFANAALRADAAVIIGNRRGQSGLWGYSISGDLPIVMVQISDRKNIDLVRQLVQAHAYWRMKGLAVDLVIWNEDRGGYRQLLQEQILGLIAAGTEANVIDRPGGIFVRPAEQIAAEDRMLLLAVSRAIVSDARGPLAEQVRRRDPPELPIPRFAPVRGERLESAPAPPLPARELVLDNGRGGFSADGSEYVITTRRGAMTPAPWCNVLANPAFGSVVTESGSAYTWAENAHEFRLTPWHNDPIGDPSGEAFYLRDEDSGRYWSPAPQPCGGDSPYVTRHGFGYSVFEHVEEGIQTELWTYVALDAPVKFMIVKLRNVSGRPRRLTLTGYVEWVLGDLRPRAATHTITEIDPNGGALLARNAFNSEFADAIAFFDVDDATRTLTGDRGEFIGRNGSLQRPAAMLRARLSGRVGAAMDPCGAIQVPIELGVEQSRDVIFRLGMERGVDNASALILRLRRSGSARAALDAIRAYWKRTLGVIQVRTGQPALDLLANGWLVYQTIACRLWGRSGYYQSGGAYGFRDQLQDAMALVHAAPELLRQQLLRCASRQFREGDVQHWWHPPSGRGVRTHCSDDYLWLPLATSRYLAATGDDSVLAQRSSFLDGRLVGAGEDSYYDLPMQSQESADLYEHCVRALRNGLKFGAHGLPLIGSGDWNDGFNNVGIHGRGESVWLGFFLHHVLTSFIAVAQLRSDAMVAELCRSESATLRANLERHAWDGGWYRRAWFDDGTPLGASSNVECQIDSIAQSWSVLSGVAQPERARTAMDALEQRLVDREHALIKLLDPPFDRTILDPGYIKGYLPGVRENGGQYTHAAIWASMAFAALGDAQRACDLLAMILPVNHALTADAVNVFKVEPYVVCADVYSVDPHRGRGGWSWYTGSAAWLYRLIVESILGLRLEPGRLHINPCIPDGWSGFALSYRHGETTYEIVVSRDAQPGAQRLLLDGEAQGDGQSIGLVDDGASHSVAVVLGGARSAIAQVPA